MVKAPGWANLITLLSDPAYHSFTLKKWRA